MAETNETCPWCSRENAARPCEGCGRNRFRIKCIAVADDGTDSVVESWSDPAWWVGYSVTVTV